MHLNYLSDICYDVGVSFGTFSMWLWCMATVFVAPYLIFNEKFGVTGTFALFDIGAIMGFLFCMIFLKETHGLSEDECKHLYCKKEL